MGRHGGPGGPGGSQAAGTCQDQIQEEIDHSGGGHEPERTAESPRPFRMAQTALYPKTKGCPSRGWPYSRRRPHSPGRQGHQGEQRAVAEQGGRRQQGGARQRQQEQRGGGLLLFQAVPGAPAQAVRTVPPAEKPMHTALRRKHRVEALLTAARPVSPTKRPTTSRSAML